jgi:hypothetical protein
MSTPITKGMSVRRNTITGIYYITDHAGSARAQTATGTPLSEALAHQFAASGEVLEAARLAAEAIEEAYTVEGATTKEMTALTALRAALAKARGEAS